MTNVLNTGEFSKFHSYFLNHPPLTITDGVIYGIIESACRGNHTTRLFSTHIAHSALSRSTITRSIAALKQAGLITTEFDHSPFRVITIHPLPRTDTIIPRDEVENEEF